MRIFRAQDMQRRGALMQYAAMLEPILITYHDRPRLVLMSVDEYERLRGRKRGKAKAGFPAAGEQRGEQGDNILDEMVQAAE